jgi:hypothetical protein
LSPILSRMGLFLLGGTVRTYTPLRSGASWGWQEVNSGGWTTWLWINRVFGVCGELWWVSGFLRLGFGFSGGIFGSWRTTTAKNRLVKRGEMMVDRGENVVSCGRLVFAIGGFL